MKEALYAIPERKNELNAWYTDWSLMDSLILVLNCSRYLRMCLISIKIRSSRCFRHFWKAPDAATNCSLNGDGCKIAPTCLLRSRFANQPYNARLRWKANIHGRAKWTFLLKICDCSRPKWRQAATRLCTVVNVNVLFNSAAYYFVVSVK